METLVIINEILTVTLGPFGPIVMLLALLLFFGLLIVWGKSQERRSIVKIGTQSQNAVLGAKSKSL